MALRYLSKFTSPDGSSFVYTFPLGRYEYESSQNVVSPRSKRIGGDYAVRLLGSAKVVRDVANERIRCVAVGTEADLNDEVDEARSKLYLGAYGKLWTTDGTDLRWAWAELAEMPSIEVSYQRRFIQPMVFSFIRLSDWFDATPISASATKTASPATLEVTNHGNIAAKRVVITVMGTFDDIKIVNDANGHELHVNFTGASSDDGIKLDTSVPAIYTTDDGGVNWTPNYGIYNSPPLTQKLLSFELEPGAQELTLTSGGSPNYSIEVTAEAPFA